TRAHCFCPLVRRPMMNSQVQSASRARRSAGGYRARRRAATAPALRRMLLAYVSLLLVLQVSSAAAQAVHSATAGSGGGKWWNDAVCYEIFVRSCVDSDGDGVGDLKGLTSRLDYINDGNPKTTRDLGANCVWLMPIAKSVSYHGYDVTDYYHVNPPYGTDEDFKRFVSEAHR